MTPPVPSTLVRDSGPPSAPRRGWRGHGAGAEAGATKSSLTPRGRRGISVSTLLTVDVALLCVIGLVMVGTASSVVSIATYGSPWAILIREPMWMGIGAVVLVLMVRLDYRKLRRLSPLILVGTFGLLCIVLVPGLGVHAEGSSRWVGFGQLRLQPSELMKFALTLFVADFVARRLDEDSAGSPDHRTGAHRDRLGLCPDPRPARYGNRHGARLHRPLAAVRLRGATPAGHEDPRGTGRPGVGGRPDLPLSPRAPAFLRRPVGPRLELGLPGGPVAHRPRVRTLFGTGLGRGQQQWGFLPNAHTDFIFSVIGEELGIVGACLVLVLLGSLLWLGIRAATHSPDRFGGLLALGIVAWIAAETLINIGAVVGVLPVTGIPLPFISFGGSSLVITMAAAGVLVNIARQGESLEVSQLARVPRLEAPRPPRRTSSGIRRSTGHGRDR